MNSKRPTPASSTPKRSSLKKEAFPTGPLSGYVYEQAKNPPSVIDETCPPDVPYAKTYYSVSEYLNYRDEFTDADRSTFLMLVAFSMQSDGL